MYNISDLASMTTPQLTDLLVEARGTASYKLLISDLAKAVVETYAASDLGGSARSVKSAIDSLNSRLQKSIIEVTAGTESPSNVFETPASTYPFYFLVYAIGNASYMVAFCYVRQSALYQQVIATNIQNTSSYATLEYIDNKFRITNNSSIYLRGILVSI